MSKKRVQKDYEYKTIKVSEGIHHKLSILKAKLKKKDFDEIISYLIIKSGDNGDIKQKA